MQARTTFRSLALAFVVIAAGCRTPEGETALKDDQPAVAALPPKHQGFDAHLKTFLQHNYAAWAENYLVVADLSLCNVAGAAEANVTALDGTWKAVLQIPLNNHAHTLVGAGAVTCAFGGDGAAAAKAMAEMRKAMLQQGFFNTTLTNKISGVLAAAKSGDALARFQAVRKAMATAGVLPFADHEYASAILATCSSDATGSVKKMAVFWKEMLKAGYHASPFNAPAAARLACRYEEAAAEEAVKKLTESFKSMVQRGYTNAGWILTVAATLAE